MKSWVKVLKYMVKTNEYYILKKVQEIELIKDYSKGLSVK